MGEIKCLTKDLLSYLRGEKIKRLEKLKRRKGVVNRQCESFSESKKSPAYFLRTPSLISKEKRGNDHSL